MFGRTLKSILVIAAIAAVPMVAVSADLQKTYASEDDFINFDGKDSKVTPNAEGTFAQRQKAQAQVNANQEVPANTTAPAPKLSTSTTVTSSTATTTAPAPKPAQQ